MFVETSLPLWASVFIVAWGVIGFLLPFCWLLYVTYIRPREASIVQLVAVASVFSFPMVLGAGFAMLPRVENTVYSNPNSVVEASVMQKLLSWTEVQTDAQSLEATIIAHSGADKVALPEVEELDYDQLQDGGLKTFTGVVDTETGPKSLSGTFYFTEDTLVIITSVEEEQETVVVPAK